jgi:hypothetical protein
MKLQVLAIAPEFVGAYRSACCTFFPRVPHGILFFY